MNLSVSCDSLSSAISFPRSWLIVDNMFLSALKETLLSSSVSIITAEHAYFRLCGNSFKGRVQVNINIKLNNQYIYITLEKINCSPQSDCNWRPEVHIKAIRTIMLKQASVSIGRT